MLTVSDNHIVLGGGGGGGGSTTFVGLSDKETADLPGTNTPLANALSGKEASANKKTDVDANKTSDTFFPSVKAVFDWVTGLFVKGASSSTDNAIACFDGTTGKALKSSNVLITDTGQMTVGDATHSYSSKVSIKDTNAATTAIALEVRGVSSAGWSGRIVAGGNISAFLMGQFQGSAWLGAHNAALTAWSDFYVNPDGTSKCYVGAVGGFGGGALATFDNAVGKIGIRTTSPTEVLDVNGASRFRGSIVFNGQIIDNVGSSGTDGQVLKKVGGQVVWANP